MGSWNAAMEVMRRAAGDTQKHAHACTQAVSFLYYVPAHLKI
jgi:hypothetical protein